MDLKHDPVRRELYCTSRWRALGGVAWSRSPHFSSDASSLSTWSLLSNLSRATAPIADRPKRHAPAPVFEKMRSHVDLMKMGDKVDERPPLHPRFDDQSKARVKITKPTKSKRQLMAEQAAAQAARERKRDKDMLQDRKVGEFGLWEEDEHAGSNNNDSHKNSKHHQGNKKLTLFERMQKEEAQFARHEPFLAKAQAHSTQRAPAFSNAPRFRESQEEIEQRERKLRRKKKLREQQRRSRQKRRRTGSPFSDGSGTAGDEDYYGDEVLDDEALFSGGATRPGTAATKTTTSGTLNASSTTRPGTAVADASPSRRHRSKAEVMLDDPDPGLVVDFSSKPFSKQPAWSFGKPPSGETHAQRKKRQAEEDAASEALYAFHAKQEEERRKAANAAAVLSSEQQMIARANGSGRHTPDIGRVAPRDSTPKRREYFLELFRRASASPSGAGHSQSRPRSRTPTAACGTLLSGAGHEHGVAEQLHRADASMRRAERTIRVFSATPSAGHRTPTPTAAGGHDSGKRNYTHDNHHDDNSATLEHSRSAASLRREVSMAASPSIIMPSPSFVQ